MAALGCGCVFEFFQNDGGGHAFVAGGWLIPPTESPTPPGTEFDGGARVEVKAGNAGFDVDEA
jgi:hypothetical protein